MRNEDIINDGLFLLDILSLAQEFDINRLFPFFQEYKYF